MAGPDLMALAEAERNDLLDLLRGLTPAQWAAPSLCAGWRVRDVAVHVVGYDELAPTGLAGAFLRGRLRPDAVNEVVLARHRHLDLDGVLALVDRCRRPRGLTAALGGRIALTDGTIHHQDVRRALGLPRTIPAQRLVPVLDFALRAPTLPARRLAKGLRLRATDLDWVSGDGPEVRGPGEALLLAAAGRPHPLDELDGEGAALLRRRVGA